MEQTVLTAPVGGIQKFSTEDGPGIRTTVFLKGCPLNCKWCHNPELISFERELIRMPNSCIHCGYCIAHCPQQAIRVHEDGQVRIDRERCDKCMLCVKECYAQAIKEVSQPMTVAQVMDEVRKDKGFYERTGGGLTISGGEMLSHEAFAEELVTMCGQEGIGVCLDTTGFGNSEALLRMARASAVTDILYDMKCIDSDRHKELTGRDNRLILENLCMLAADETVRPKLHMRMPLIAGLNDTRAFMEATAAFYKEHKIGRLTILPYHNLGISKSRHIGSEQELFAAPEDAYLEELRDYFASEAGMHVEISSKMKPKEET